MRSIKEKRGITLIALAVTIVVILILAGVTIDAVFSENGIINKAKEAANAMNNAVANDQKELNDLFNELNEIMNSEWNENNEIDVPLIPDIPDLDGSFNEEKGVNSPVIKEDMELVKFEEETQEWVKDETNSDYSYIAKEETGDNNQSHWANARVTIDGIESYFVWIPRYAYKIDTTNRKIDVKFLKNTGVEAVDGTICKYADDGTLNTNTDYIIHPAFTSNVNFGGWREELPGLWIGKYESSLVNKSDGSNIDTNSATIGDIIVDETNNIDKAIAIQPGMKSWRFCKTGNGFTNAKAFSINLNSHLLKNSEWGAIAYLTHSKYREKWSRGKHK